MECREEGYLYIKIDDDVVLICKNPIRHLVAAKEAHPRHLLVSANLIDSPVSTPIHDRMGSIKSYLPGSTPLQSTSRPSWRASELPQWNGPIDFSIAKRSSEPVTKHRWLPLGPHDDLARTSIKKRSWSRYKAKLAIWTVAAQEHYSFLENLKQMRLLQGSSPWSSTDEYNCDCNMGRRITDNGPVPGDDERYLTIDLPRRFRRYPVMDGMAIASHLSYRGQESLESTDLLDRYRAYSEEKNDRVTVRDSLRDLPHVMEFAHRFLCTASPASIISSSYAVILTLFIFSISLDGAPLPERICPNYNIHSQSRHQANRSKGRYQLPFQRPTSECRSFYSWEIEDVIERLQYKIKDPDLFRLFENAFANTLDTTVRWKGFAWENATQGLETDEDLAFVTTGDINAMWLRDSANQILSYTPILIPSQRPDSLAALFRGIINAHSRYIKFSPYCHAYQPLPESKIPQQTNYAYSRNIVTPPYDRTETFDCKWELDSLASFLQLSSEYYNVTNDLDPFEKYTWVDTVEIILNAVDAMRVGTYTVDGHIQQPGYTMTGQTNRATETTSNNGHGNPVAGHTGLIRSTFRPSDDATIFQFLIPSNMMFAVHLETSSEIMYELGTLRSWQLGNRMLTMASEIRAGISKHGIIVHPQFGAMYAFEVDGYGSQNLMDDANLPSLLSASWMGYVDPTDEVYLHTRKFALSEANPYWAFGDVFNAIGGPHLGPSKGWPLASIVRAMTSQDGSGDEIRQELRAILGTTDGLGLVHESVNAHDAKDWSRHWFGWANGMFGQLILRLEAEWPELLEESYQ